MSKSQFRTQCEVPELRVALLSKTGSGKSSLGNLMLSNSDFEVSNGFNSATDRCQAAAGEAAGRRIVVVDTPGTLDTRDKEAPLMELTKMIRLSPEGFHAFLIVVKCGTRYTDEEHEAIEVLRKLFGDRCLEFSIVVFTHGGVFDNNEDTLRSKLDEARQQQPRLNELMSLCGDRLALVDSGQNCSQTEKKRQVNRLLSRIEELVDKNNGDMFTNEFFEEAQQELARLKQLEEKREQEKQELEERLRNEMAQLKRQMSDMMELEKRNQQQQHEREMMEQQHEQLRLEDEVESLDRQVKSMLQNLLVRGALALSKCSIQ